MLIYFGLQSMIFQPALSIHHDVSNKQHKTVHKKSRQIKTFSQTFKQEKTRGGTVKGKRFGPPVNMCFLTVSMICNSVHGNYGTKLSKS